MPEGGVRLPVQRAGGLRDAREQADPLHHLHAHQGHPLQTEVVQVTTISSWRCLLPKASCTRN